VSCTLIHQPPTLPPSYKYPTPQSAAALSAIRAWSANTINTMVQIAENPDGYFAGKMTELEASLKEGGENAALVELGKQAEQGNKTAANLFQKAIANQQFNGREYIDGGSAMHACARRRPLIRFFPFSP
jgi:hypothetical protein